MNRQLFFVFCIVISLQIIYTTKFETIVSTHVGKIAGLQKHIQIGGQRRVLTEFLGIPYGENTSGKNRFRRSIPKAYFRETFKAYTISPSCMQLSVSSAVNTNMTEDCLMLNIYVPLDFRMNGTSECLPVMTWVHGGGYISGSANVFNGEILATISGIIVITINYRLAELGFFDVGEARASGNQGLFDQHLAFKWIKNNIRAFRGDPDRITIFGESAGGQSVLLHSLYEGNKGMFNRVIAQSGTALAFGAISDGLNVNHLFELAGCDTNTTDAVDCLRNMSSDEFLNLIRSPELGPVTCCPYGPIVDHDFIIENPRDILFGHNPVSSGAREFFRTLDIITGVNNGEGGVETLFIWLAELKQKDIDTLTVTVSDIRDTIVPWIVSKALKKSPNNITLEALKTSIAFEYTDWQRPNDNNILRRNLLDIASDIAYFVPAVQTLEAHSKTSNRRSYLYEFTAEPSSHLLPTASWFKGANHGDELQFLWGFPLSNETSVDHNSVPLFSSEEYSFSLGMIKAWSNFAKTG